MLKKNILILLLSLGVFPALCMDAPLKLTQHQAIDDELVTVELQGGQLFKVQARHAKLSQTLKNLIDDVGTDGVLPIPNVSSEVWSKIVALMPHLLDITLEATNQQAKKQAKINIFKTIQSYDGATLVEFIKAVNFLDIPFLLDAAIIVAKKTGIRKITLQQIMALPKDIRNSIILGQVIDMLGRMPYTLRAVCNGYKEEVVSVCISPDGNTIVTGSNDSSVRIWNNNGTLRAVCNGHTELVGSVCISADGNTIVSGSEDGTVRIWNNDGTLRAVCNGHANLVRSVCISADGNTIVSGSDDYTVRIWNRDGTLRAVCNGHTEAVDSVCISIDGNTIVSGSDDHSVRIWNTDGTLRAVCNGHTDWVVTLCISAGGNTIVSGSRDETMRIWNRDGIQRAVCNGHTGSVLSVCISADGKTIASGCNDGVVRIWNSDGTLRDMCYDHTSWLYDQGGVFAVRISADGNTIVSGSDDYTVLIWNGDGTLRAVYNNHALVCISLDGNTIVSGSYDGTMSIWDTQMFASLLKNMNTEQAQCIWIFLQIKLLPMLRTGLVKVDTNNCWAHIKAIMEAHDTKTAQADKKVSGSESALKRQKSGN